MRTTAIFLAAMTAFAIHADLSLHLVPGEMEGHIGSLAEASGKVTLKGSIRAEDFSPLKSLSEDVKVLDMSGVSIIGSSSNQPDIYGRRTYPAGRIPDYAFFQCKVKEVILPEESELGAGAFAESSSENVTLGLKATIIPDHAFYKCAIKNLRNTGHIHWIGKEAFSMSSAESLSFPSLTKAADFSFAGMPNLKEITFAYDCMLGTGTLMDCPKLNRIHGMTTILPDYFVANSGISALPSKMSIIGQYAFANSAAETLVISNGLALIEEGACMGMAGLKRIYVTDCKDIIPSVEATAFQGLKASSITLHVYPGTTDLWKGHEIWGRFNITDIPDSVDEIAPDFIGISIRIAGGTVEIESDTPLISIDAYDQNGFNIYHDTPSANTHSFPTSINPGHGAMLLRATNTKGDKTIKLML